MTSKEAFKLKKQQEEDAAKAAEAKEGQKILETEGLAAYNDWNKSLIVIAENNAAKDEAAAAALKNEKKKRTRVSRTSYRSYLTSRRAQKMGLRGIRRRVET